MTPADRALPGPGPRGEVGSAGVVPRGGPARRGAGATSGFTAGRAQLL